MILNITSSTLQSIAQLGASSNFTFILLFRLNSTEQIEQTIKMYLRGVFPQGWSYDMKIAEYKRLTADHHFLFLDNWAGRLTRCRLDLSE